MKTLIVGAGTLGGIIGARLLAAGASGSIEDISARLYMYRRDHSVPFESV